FSLVNFPFRREVPPRRSTQRSRSGVFEPASSVRTDREKRQSPRQSRGCTGRAPHPSRAIGHPSPGHCFPCVGRRGRPPCPNAVSIRVAFWVFLPFLVPF